MRIAMFTYGISGTRMTGIARYAVELTRAMHVLDPSCEIILLDPNPPSTHPWYDEFERYPMPALRHLPLAATLGNWQLHRAALDLRVDILHDPCGIAPFLAPRGPYKRVTTVHDAVPYVYPKTQPLLTRLLFRTLIPAAGRTADAVLTVSEASAADLARHAGIPRHKLHVTPNGVVMPAPVPTDERDRLRASLQLGARYFLYVGALHPRKNLDRVLAAFEEVRASDGSVQLAIVGPPSWGAHATLRAVTDHSAADTGVRLTGFVADRDLDALYGDAVALVFPSLYEGFGLPALEAMAHGLPVITSTTSSMPEVVGDAGILVDPTSTTDIASAMKRLLADPTERDALREKGLARAVRFSWTRTAEATRAVYRRLLELDA